MITSSQAFTIIDRVCSNASARFQTELAQSKKIDINDCLNCILAETQFSQLNLPSFDKSSMDGYAILASDRRAGISKYQLIETVAAGNSAKKTLQPGTTIKIMTGAPTPLGTGIIVPIEMTKSINDNDGGHNEIEVIAWPHSNNIYLCGEDVKRDSKILERGTILSPAAIANLVACGITSVPIYRKLRIAIITTGDEIVDDVAAITDAKIMNSNGPMLTSLCSKYGFKITINSKIPDDYDATVNGINKALDLADIILLSGGVSTGDFDFVTKALLAANLKIHFNRVAIKPGKPVTFASNIDINGDTTKLIFGLPGNPVAAYLTFHLLVLRAISKILNAIGPELLPKFNNTLPLAQDFKRSSLQQVERTEYIPCYITPDGTLMPLKYHGSAHLAVLLECNGFFIVASGITTITAGDKVPFVLTAI